MSEVVDNGIRSRKFGESRREHYERLYAADPIGTARLIASLAPGPATSVPTRQESGLVGGIFDPSQMEVKRITDTEIGPGGVSRPALRAWPRPTTDPSEVAPLPWFERRASKRVTFAE
jgi:hypothetical protein